LKVPEVFVAPDPQRAAASAMRDFARFLEEDVGARFEDYGALYRFSVDDYGRFWAAFLRWSRLEVEGSLEPACRGEEIESAVFFPNLRTSYAENLLRPLGAEAEGRDALVSVTEEGLTRRCSRGELRERVSRAASGLKAQGLASGDRVVAVARNTAESVVACLAATALGASWSSTAPDLGSEAMLSRFQQLQPVLLFAHCSYPYQGVRRDQRERLRDLIKALPTLRALVLLEPEEAPEGLPIPVVRLSDLEGAQPLPRFERLPFNHPLFILFSSGTTGVPKCIVHGAGGTLLEHVKEHRLHSDLGPADRLLFHTSAGWMMWNWLISALASGTTVVLYDGSVTHPDADALWQVVAREKVTVFGTSPAYLQYCRDAGIVPRERADLEALRAMQSTGSILFDNHYDWVRDNIKALPLQSISGGTDIIGCFVLGNPTLPVYRGESQCVSAGLDVRALTAEGAVKVGTGELVCAAPFPSRPIGLFGDGDGRRFHEAYFAQNAGYWTHGDFIELTERGSARIMGRSDGVLNVRGIRIGPAEIYHVLQDIAEIAEAMAVEQAAPAEPGGARLILLVVLRDGRTLDRPLTLRIKRELSRRASPAHVPAVVVQMAELPTTFSGKRSERAARDAVNGRVVANAGALRNPECLEALRGHADLRTDSASTSS
jgi:acetoacetyl-CoA synthetase